MAISAGTGAGRKVVRASFFLFFVLFLFVNGLWLLFLEM
jgi:hypothetical protein